MLGSNVYGNGIPCFLGLLLVSYGVPGGSFEQVFQSVRTERNRWSDLALRKGYRPPYLCVICAEMRAKRVTAG